MRFNNSKRDRGIFALVTLQNIIFVIKFTNSCSYWYFTWQLSVRTSIFSWNYGLFYLSSSSFSLSSCSLATVGYSGASFLVLFFISLIISTYSGCVFINNEIVARCEPFDDNDEVSVEVNMNSTPRTAQFFHNGKPQPFMLSGLPESVRICVCFFILFPRISFVFSFAFLLFILLMYSFFSLVSLNQNQHVKSSPSLLSLNRHLLSPRLSLGRFLNHHHLLLQNQMMIHFSQSINLVKKPILLLNSNLSIIYHLFSLVLYLFIHSNRLLIFYLSRATNKLKIHIRL